MKNNPARKLVFCSLKFSYQPGGYQVTESLESFSLVEIQALAENSKDVQYVKERLLEEVKNRGLKNCSPGEKENLYVLKVYLEGRIKYLKSF